MSDLSEELTCKPLDSYAEIMMFVKDLPPWRTLCKELTPHSELKINNMVIHNRREIHLDMPETFCHFNPDTEDPVRTERASLPKTLVCHDMANGYQDDSFIDGTGEKDAYTFYNWAGIDIFCYFSHHLITIPPVGWINVGHAHGVKVIGTVITEWSDGAQFWKSILESESLFQNFANALVTIAKTLKFDGWLLNIENKIYHPGLLLEFVQHLHNLLHLEIPGSLLIWYDSVTIKGHLNWQNGLNSNNKAFFNSCDGIFTNYSWTEYDLTSSSLEAGDRITDLYIGIDIWGRNFFGGGKFKTQEALKLIHEHGCSVAIFAPAWTHEDMSTDERDPNFIVMAQELDKGQRFLLRDRALWNSLWPFLTTQLPCALPFKTSFCRGLGKKRRLYGEVISRSPWYNLRLQHYQPNSSHGSHAYLLSTEEVIKKVSTTGVYKDTKGIIRYRNSFETIRVELNSSNRKEVVEDEQQEDDENENNLLSTPSKEKSSTSIEKKSIQRKSSMRQIKKPNKRSFKECLMQFCGFKPAPSSLSTDYDQKPVTSKGEETTTSTKLDESQEKSLLPSSEIATVDELRLTQKESNMDAKDKKDSVLLRRIDDSNSRELEIGQTRDIKPTTSSESSSLNNQHKKKNLSTNIDESSPKKTSPPEKKRVSIDLKSDKLKAHLDSAEDNIAISSSKIDDSNLKRAHSTTRDEKMSQSPLINVSTDEDLIPNKRPSIDNVKECGAETSKMMDTTRLTEAEAPERQKRAPMAASGKDGDLSPNDEMPTPSVNETQQMEFQSDEKPNYDARRLSLNLRLGLGTAAGPSARIALAAVPKERECLELYLDDSFIGGSCLRVHPSDEICHEHRLTRLFHCDFLISESLVACVVTKPDKNYPNQYVNMKLRTVAENGAMTRVELVGRNTPQALNPSWSPDAGGILSLSPLDTNETRFRDIQKHLLLNETAFYVPIENYFGWNVRYYEVKLPGCRVTSVNLRTSEPQGPMLLGHFGLCHMPHVVTL